MDKAFELHQQGRKIDAVGVFINIVEEHPKHPDHAKNLYNIASIYQEINDVKQAHKWYTKILRLRGLRDDVVDNSRGVLETHANHKHFAAYNLGVLYHNNANYDKALRYYKLATKRYPYHNFAPRNARINEIRLAFNIADCYIQKGAVERGIATLFPYAITTPPTKLFDPADKLIEILDAYDLIQNFKQELDKALDYNLEIRSYGIDLALYTIKIKIKRYQNEILTKAGIKRSSFYQQLLVAEE